MNTSTTQRRKGGGAPKSNDVTVEVATTPKPAVAIATVRRNKCGTGPFDESWLNLDCCGLFCALFTYGLHTYGVYAVCLVLLPPWMSETSEEGLRTLSWMGHFHRFAFSFIAAMAVFAHFKAMTTDPGAVPPDAQPLEPPSNNQVTSSIMDPTAPGANSSTPTTEEGGDLEIPPVIPPRRGKKLCRRCNAFKPKRAHHCSVCRRCIIKMDHHCPWVNNCVGIGNHKYFLLFVFYTFLSCVYSMSLVIIRFISCMHSHGRLHSRHMTCLDRPTQLLTILGLVVEALLFGLFTACMMIDQAGVVTSKMTHIDRLKGGDDDNNNSSGSPSLAGVIEVFGSTKRGSSRFRPDWLSPFTAVCFPSALHDEIMGFCRPCGSSNNNNNNNNNDMETELTGPPTKMVRSVAEIV